MSQNPSSHKFAMAIGASGAMVEVTTDVMLNEGGVTRRWGRQSTFSDTAPGQFSFTLDNRDGNYTPDNPGSTLLTRVVEGMRVAWELNGEIRSGTISNTQLIFPSEGTVSAARIRITVSDVLAAAARTSWESIISGMVAASGALAYWPLDDVAGSAQAVETSGRVLPALDKFFPDVAGATASFGAAGVPRIGTTAAMMAVPVNSGPIEYVVGLRSPSISFDYPTDLEFGWWGAWLERGFANLQIGGGSGIGKTRMTLDFGFDKFTLAITYTGGIEFGWASGTPNTSYAIDNDDFHYFNVHVFRPNPALAGVRATLYYMGGQFAGVTSNQFPISRNKRVAVTVEAANAPGEGAFQARFSQLSHTSNILSQELGVGATAATRLPAIAATVPGLTFDTLPSDLSNSALGDPGASSALDAINTIIRGEQGHVWSTSSGTLLAPVEKVAVRARTRPDAVTASFSTSTDISGSPDFQRSITDMVSAVTVTGPSGKVIVYQHDLESRVGSANTSATVALASGTDLLSFGQDRILRGINKGIDVVSFAVDATGTTTNRWVQLSSLTPGLKYRVADLPLTQFGSSYWDGWFLGATESHDGERSVFTLFFERALARTAIYDTDRYMADGALTLTANINASVTSMSVATSDATVKLSTTETPYVLQIDSEQINVTAVTGATPQVVTMTRGFNGTTAAAHTLGALIDLATPTLYAY